jgi:hypothetical protein
MTMTPGIKTSEFWTHLALLLATGATFIGTAFDHAFLTNHPVLAAVVGGAAMVVAGASQIAYTIGRSIVKSADHGPVLSGPSDQ